MKMLVSLRTFFKRLLWTHRSTKMKNSLKGGAGVPPPSAPSQKASRDGGGDGLEKPPRPNLSRKRQKGILLPETTDSETEPEWTHILSWEARSWFGDWAAASHVCAFDLSAKFCPIESRFHVCVCRSKDLHKAPSGLGRRSRKRVWWSSEGSEPLLEHPQEMERRKFMHGL